jgi:hypothetical protein
MDYGNRRTADDRFEQASRTVLRWILGPGFLSLHIGVYLITLVALLLWNFARTPNDVWVDGPLRRWGLVVVFHITAVAVGWAAWRLMRLGDLSPTTPKRTPGMGTTRSSRQYGSDTAAVPVNRAPSLQPQPQPQPAMNNHSQSVPPPDDGARHWFRDSVRLVREAVSDSPTTGTSTSPAASTVSGPGITEWGVLFVRRTREMMASARDHVSPSQHARQTKLNGTLNGVTVSPPPDPMRTWPESTPNSTEPTSDTHSTPVNGTWPTPTNASLVDESQRHGSNGTAYPFPDHTPIDPVQSTAVPTAPTKEVDPAANEEARWTWVAAWMSHRERDDPPIDPPETPPPSTDDATTTP